MIHFRYSGDIPMTLTKVLLALSLAASAFAQTDFDLLSKAATSLTVRAISAQFAM